MRTNFVKFNQNLYYTDHVFLHNVRGIEHLKLFESILRFLFFK